MTIPIMIPERVTQVIETIKKAGFDCYIVGGCVRDILIGRKPKDYDLATNALPESVIKLFPCVIETGLKHGTVTVVTDNTHIEVTTLRCDGIYRDYRRPEEVTFTDNIYEDLARRDFTVNAIAIKNNEIIDPFNGRVDIVTNTIRAVNDPDDRFKEDALRMMRAVRFSCQLGFGITQSTLSAMKRNSDLLKYISKERIRDEFDQIILSERSNYGISCLVEVGLMDHIIPELMLCVDFDQKSTYHNKDVFNHLIATVETCEKDLALRLAALLHDIAKPDCFEFVEGYGRFIGHEKEGAVKAEQILRRLKYNNRTIETVKLLIENHMYKPDKVKNGSIRRFIERVKFENLETLFLLQRADIRASAHNCDFSSIDYLQEKVIQFINQKKPLTVKNLALNGYDLMNIGINEGPRIGYILKSLLELVLVDKCSNENSELLTKAKELSYSRKDGLDDS